MRLECLARAVVVSTLALLCACGDDEVGGECEPAADDGADSADGCRLSARYVSFEGGEPVQVGWYDGDLETPCEFEVAADGLLRCLPDGAGYRQFFSSPDCEASSALVRVPVRYGLTPAFMLEADYNFCPLRTRIFRVGPEHDGPVYDGIGPGMCRKVEASADIVNYRLGEEVLPVELVSAEREARGDGRLQDYVLVAEDGARQPAWQFRDTELGEDCVFGAAADGSYRCMPGDFRLGESDPGFGDKACSQEVGRGESCSQSMFGLRRDSRACQERWTAYELGESIDTSVVFVVDGEGECSGVQITPDEGELPIVRSVAGEVEPAELVGVEPELRGEGRVRARWAQLDGGRQVFLGWFDTVTDCPCQLDTIPGDAGGCPDPMPAAP